MDKLHGVIDIHSNLDAALRSLAKHLGRNKVRRAVFELIYGRARLPMSVSQILEKSKIGSSQRQQVINAVNHLSSHHLISKVPNDGQVGDGSQFLYGKVDQVRANRKRIISIADGADATPAPRKRSPSSEQRPPPKRSNKRGRIKKTAIADPLHVLYLTANPADLRRLEIDREVRKVQESVRRAEHRDRVVLDHRPAADLQSVLDGLNDARPTVVLFSGHGDIDAISVDDHSSPSSRTRLLEFSILTKALAATDKPPAVVVLNSCLGARGVAPLLNSVDVVIAMNDSIEDEAAAAFASQFFGALASGQSVQSAFEQGRVAIESVVPAQRNIAELHCRSSVDPRALTLV